MNTDSLVQETPSAGKAAVVVLSGGQDSVTCLGLALKNFETVYAVGFSYGQKHITELAQAARICQMYFVPFQVFQIPVLEQLGDSALTTDGDVNQVHHRNKDLPASFVPNRNAMFLTMAHAYAQKVGAVALITGVCETDYSGYPDCRADFIELIEEALNTGYLTNIEIHTPLMYLTKAETFELADQCGFLDTVIHLSHTCYNGNRTDFHEWGYGCGGCPACRLRESGYLEFVASRNQI